MDEMISRQAVLKLLSTMPPEEAMTKAMLIQSVKQLPAAQPETAKRIVGKSRDGMTLWYQCDMCNEPVDAKDDFCRGCGRRLVDEGIKYI